MGRRVWLVAIAGALATLAAVATPAAAAPVTVHFDDLPAGTVLTDQYLHPELPGKGVRFGIRPDGSAGELPRVLAKADAPSPPNTAYVQASSGEFCDVNDGSIYGRFEFARQEVSLTGAAQADNEVRLIGYNGQGDEVDSAAVAASPGTFVQLNLTAPTGESIVYFELEEAALGCATAFADNIVFDDLAGQPLPDPDFGLAREQGLTHAVGLLREDSTTVDFRVNRFNGASGPLQFSLAGLPAGVTASFPGGNPTPGGEVAVTLTASKNAKIVDERPVTLTATPTSPAAGSTARSIEFPLTVHGRYDLRVTGMEVTQGIQEQFQPCASTSQCAAVATLPFPPSDNQRTIDYQGVRLVAGKTTAVRVFANVKTGDAVNDVTVALHGFRNGKELPGPLVSGSGRVTPGSLEWATWTERTDPDGGFLFLLPPEWTKAGKIDLVAEIVPPFGFVGTTDAECETASCLSNNKLRTKGVGFLSTGYLDMATARLWHQGEDVSDFASSNVFSPRFDPDPKVAFGFTEQLLPLREGGLDYDRYAYYATIEVTDIFNFKDVVAPDGTVLLDFTSGRRSMARKRLDEYADDNPGCSWARFCADSIVGVYGPGITNTGSSVRKLAAMVLNVQDPAAMRFLGDGAAGYVGDDHVAVTSYASPGTGLHEISHGVGRIHGDTACGGNSNGQTGENLTADGRGTLDGVGYDIPARRPVAHGSLGSIAEGGATSTYVDYMSYCSGPGWTTVIGWEKNIALLRALALAKKRARPVVGPAVDSVAAPAEAARAAGDVDFLRVRAFADPSGAGIESVVPRSGTPQPGPASSSFVLVARDASGAELSRTPMTVDAAITHDTAQSVVAEADVPAAGVVALEVLRDGVSIGSRAASATPPEVRLLAPKRGDRVGKRKETVVRWRATDADGNPLEIKIDYSINDGRSWEPIYLGPNAGSTRVPSHMLAGSTRARIRIRANDGFHEVAARSARLRAIRRKPTLAITTPGPLDRVRADETVPLAVIAHDDRRAPIRGRRQVTWFEGDRVIARGDLTSVTGLRPGTRRLRAVVRDRRGTKASTNIPVRVLPATPQIIELDAPRRVSSRARSVKLRLRTSIPAKLQVRGGGAPATRAEVSRRPRTVRVRVQPGGKALRLRLRVSSGNRTRTATLRIRRARI